MNFRIGSGPWLLELAKSLAPFLKLVWGDMWLASWSAAEPSRRRPKCVAAMTNNQFSMLNLKFTALVRGQASLDVPLADPPSYGLPRT
jgi:hypothetical protein